jgi:hypothetical protein
MTALHHFSSIPHIARYGSYGDDSETSYIWL